MHWDQIIGVIVALGGAAGVGAFIASYRKSGSEVKASDLDRMTRVNDETREDVDRLRERMVVVEGQYRALWDEKVAIQQAHAALQADHATLMAEHKALMAERARWQTRERELEATVASLKAKAEALTARVAELERAATPATGGGS